MAVDSRGNLPPSTLGLGGPRSVAIGDLDGDGDLDIISANENTDNLTIFDAIH